jgi:hypothetical protein
MKKNGFIFTLLLLAFIASACANAHTLAPAEDTLSTIYTAVALTLTPLTNSVTLAKISIPVSNPIPWATSTQIPATAAFQVFSTPTPIYSSGCDNSIYVSDVTIPDGTEVTPGETFVKTWMFENTGSCTWSSNYSLIFLNGDQLEGAKTTIDQSIIPGEQANISVELTAPDANGIYTGYWILANKQGNTFGTAVYVKIIVSSDAATNTPTLANTSVNTLIPFPTLTKTYTPTDTITPTPTDTVTPTPTNTFVPTPTNTPTFTPTFTPTAQEGESSE